MHTTTLLGSRLAQLGLSDEIRHLERAKGSLVARRRAIELLMCSDRRADSGRTTALVR